MVESSRPPSAEPRLQAFSLADLAEQPWQNGGGLTQQIAAGCWSSSVQAQPDFDWDWRVSVARIAISGDFSRFPGIDRSAVLVGDAPIRLRNHSGRIDFLVVGTVHAFDGGDEWFGTIEVGRPARLFNVMSRRTTTRYRVAVLDEHARWAMSANERGVLLAQDGEVRVSSGARVRVLQPGHGLVVEGVEGALVAEPSATPGRDRARLIVACFSSVKSSC